SDVSTPFDCWRLPQTANWSCREVWGDHLPADCPTFARIRLCPAADNGRTTCVGPPRPSFANLSIVAEVGSEQVQAAYDAAVVGAVEPLVALLSPELEWRGIERGHWLWRKAPA